MLNGNEVTDYWFRPCRKLPIEGAAVEMNEEFYTDGPSGRQTGMKGDFLMKGVDGEHYPCPKKVFERSYEWSQPAAPGQRIGTFKLDANQVFSNSPAISKILGAVDITYAKIDAVTEMITYVATSELFDEVKLGDARRAPEYHMFLVFELVIAERVPTHDDMMDALSYARIPTENKRSPFFGGVDFSNLLAVAGNA